MKKLSIQQLKQVIKEEAYKIVGDALTAKMNQNDNVKGSDSASAKVAVKASGAMSGDVHKGQKNASFEEKKSGPEKGKDPVDVTMNQSKDKGSDKEGAHVAVKKNGSFETKKSGPESKGEEPTEVDMNEMDKETGEDKAKTFVEPGAEMKSGTSSGQHKAKFSEKAKNEKETEKKIADAIVIPESFKSKKELNDFIINEAKRISGML